MLPTKIPKAEATVISAPISEIVNDTFDQSKCPTQSRFAEVGPIYKKDSQLDKNHRLAGVITCLSTWVGKD